MNEPGIVRLEPQTNAVMVQLVDGKPLVSIMLKDEDKREELTMLARKVLRLLSDEYAEVLRKVMQ